MQEGDYVMFEFVEYGSLQRSDYGNCLGNLVSPSTDGQIVLNIECLNEVNPCVVFVTAEAYKVEPASVPIGAIVGGVVGGGALLPLIAYLHVQSIRPTLCMQQCCSRTKHGQTLLPCPAVVLIVLAFLAFRRGGWLRKKRGITADASSDLDLKQSSGGLECGAADEAASCAKATGGKTGDMPTPVTKGTAASQAASIATPSSDTFVTAPTAPSVLPPYIDTTAVPEQPMPNNLPVPLSYITTAGNPGIDTFITQSTNDHTPPLGSDGPVQLRSATRSDAR